MLLAKLTFVFYLQTILVLAADIKRFIVDVDSGIDDYHALVLMIHADNQGLIKLEGIVCTKGNAETFNVYNNVFRLLETAHRTDIPVYIGTLNEILPKRVRTVQLFGEDGFADLTFKKKDSYTNTFGSPIEMDLLLYNNPKQISVMILGPCTSFAFKMRMYYYYASNVKEFFIRGGNNKVMEPEFNFLADPEAAFLILTGAQCPLTLFTWQACNQDPITFSWRFGLKDISNPVWDLVERAETKLYADKPPTDTWLSCDSMTALSAIYPDAITKQSTHYATVSILEDRGLLIIEDEANKTNANIIESIDVELFKKVFVDSFVGICKDRDCTDVSSPQDE